MKLVSEDKLLGCFKAYLEENGSIVSSGDDAMLGRLLKANAGARSLSDVEFKSRFLFVADDAVEYDEKSVNKVLLKGDGLAILAEVGKGLTGLGELTEESIEKMLRDMAEEKGVGLGKVAQPLRVAICGMTVSPPIFESVDMLGRERVLNRIRLTFERFS